MDAHHHWCVPDLSWLSLEDRSNMKFQTDSYRAISCLFMALHQTRLEDRWPTVGYPGKDPPMRAKLFGAALGAALAYPAAALCDGLVEKSAHVVAHHRGHYVGRTFGPPSQYAPVVVNALLDSCWRYRKIRGRELERIWTCRNYIKPNADLDWGYGSSIADQAWRNGYWW